MDLRWAKLPSCRRYRVSGRPRKGFVWSRARRYGVGSRSIRGSRASSSAAPAGSGEMGFASPTHAGVPTFVRPDIADLWLPCSQSCTRTNPADRRHGASMRSESSEVRLCLASLGNLAVSITRTADHAGNHLRRLQQCLWSEVSVPLRHPGRGVPKETLDHVQRHALVWRPRSYG